MVGVTEEDAKDLVRLLILLCYALLGKQKKRSMYFTGVSNIRHVYEGELPGEVSCSTESAFSRIPAPLVNCSHAGNCDILIVLMCKQL